MIVGIALTVLLLVMAIIFPQRMKSILAGILAVWLAFALWVYYDSVRSANRLNNIVATAALDATCTDPLAPMRITFENKNDVAVQHLTYTLEGFEKAFRSSVALDGYQPNARRLEAGETYSACRSFRMRNNETANPATLEWRVTINSAVFE